MDDWTPSLPHHYNGFFTTTGPSAPDPASLRSSSSCLRLDFSLPIRVQVSPVPCKSLCHGPVASTPAVVWSVDRFPPDSSPRAGNLTGFDPHFRLTTLDWLFTFVQLHVTYLTGLPGLFPLRSAPQFLAAAPRGGLKSAPACRPRRTCLHLSQSMVQLSGFTCLSFQLSLQDTLPGTRHATTETLTVPYTGV